MAAREPFYARARVTIDCDAMTDDEVVERLIGQLRMKD